MGELRTRQRPKVMVESDFGDFVGLPAVGFSHSQFDFVVQAFDDA